MPCQFAGARAAIEGLITASGAEVAVAWRGLDGPPQDELLLNLNNLNAGMTFHAASMMKVPVMVELFRQAEAGRLRLDDTLVVINRFRSIVDGSVFELSASDDSDGEMHKALGTPLTLRALCEAMITVSSNLAANLLIDQLGPQNIQATMADLGAPGMRVLRGVEDQQAFDAGLNNTTDAASLLTLFWKLGRGEVVSPAASAEMIAILKRQRFADAIPAGLPPGTVVAHKTGTMARIHHDGGIVYGARPYALVVLVRGIDDRHVSARLIADITKAIHAVDR